MCLQLFFQLLLFSDFARHKCVSTAEPLEWIPFVGGSFGGLCRERGGFLGLQMNQELRILLQFPFPTDQHSQCSEGVHSSPLSVPGKKSPLMVVLGAEASGSLPGLGPWGWAVSVQGQKGQGEPKSLLAKKSFPAGVFSELL